MFWLKPCHFMHQSSFKCIFFVAYDKMEFILYKKQGGRHATDTTTRYPAPA